MDNNNNCAFTYHEKIISVIGNCFIAKLLLIISLIISIIASTHFCSAKFSIISGLKKAFIGNGSDNSSVHSILFSKKELKYNIILDRMYNMDEKFRIVQGSDWCEKNNYVYALVNVNDVRLVCVDTAYYKELWHVDIPAYHANTVVFNPNDRKIYICGCADHRKGWVYINKIFVVDYDYPQRGIIETIEVPETSIVYSIALDKKENTWYSINAIGKKPGAYNRLYRYKGKFAATNGYVDLLFNMKVSNEGSWQGISCIHDGIAYGVFYNTPPRIVAFDLKRGAGLKQFDVPKVVSGYRQLNELESIFYDGKRNSLVMGAICTDRMTHRNMVTFVETDLLQNKYQLDYFDEYKGQAREKEKQFIATVDIGDYSFVPVRGKRFKSISDALHFANNNGYRTIDVKLYDGSHSGHNVVLSKGTIEGVNGIIEPVNNNTIKLNGYKIINSDVVLKNCIIAGQNKDKANITIENSKVKFSDCLFENVNGNITGIVARKNSTINIMDNTLFQTKYSAVFCDADSVVKDLKVQ